MIASRLPTPALKQRLKSGPALGCHWLTLGSTVLAELAAENEPDAIVVDMQHGPWDRSSLEIAVGLIAGRAPVLARTADASDWAIGSAMDAGAHGVIVPMISTADECAGVVSAARYPPNGRRSGGGARTGADFAAYRAAEQHLVTAIMIETSEGVANAEAIAATVGLDMIFIGPSDLSLSLGHGWGTPVFEGALQHLLAVGAAHGVPVGIYTVSTEQALARAAEGFRFMVAASDVAIVRGGGRTAINAFKAGAPGPA